MEPGEDLERAISTRTCCVRKLDKSLEWSALERLAHMPVHVFARPALNFVHHVVCACAHGNFRSQCVYVTCRLTHTCLLLTH